MPNQNHIHKNAQCMPHFSNIAQQVSFCYFIFPPLFFGLDKNLKVANEVLMAFCLIVSVKAKGKPEEGGKVKFTAIICGWSQGTQHQVSSDWSKGEVGVIV